MINKFSLITGGLMLASLSLASYAETVNGVNITGKRNVIEFSVGSVEGPELPPNSSSNGGACCIGLPPSASNESVRIKWQDDEDPYTSARNPYKIGTDQWYDWQEETKKNTSFYYKADVTLPPYTPETAGSVTVFFLPCHQVMAVNSNARWASSRDKMQNAAVILQRQKELLQLQQAGKCPATAFPRSKTPY